MDGASFGSSADVRKTNERPSSEINLSILLFLRPSLAYRTFSRLRYLAILIGTMTHRSWVRSAL